VTADPTAANPTAATTTTATTGPDPDAAAGGSGPAGPSLATAWGIWVARRLGLAAITLWLVSLLVFAATQALGDPARAILGRSATPDRLAALRLRLHLDEPVPLRYLHWLGGVLHGDLGTSMASGGPVSSLLGPRVLGSSVLVAAAAVIMIPLSFALALSAARRRDSVVDHGVQVVLLVLAALPEFVVGILLLALFSTTVLHWLPAVTLSDSGQPWQDPKALILPVSTLVLAVAPYVTRILRAALVEVLDSDYVEMARLKGLPERLTVRRHALPNAVVPAIQVIALQLAWLAGGVVVVEYLFSYPGIGAALVDGVRNHDVPVVQALTLFIAVVYVGVNLAADVLTILATPRLRTAVR
jgi:peptide/nickel transport system permease protein